MSAADAGDISWAVFSPFTPFLHSRGMPPVGPGMRPWPFVIIRFALFCAEGWTFQLFVKRDTSRLDAERVETSLGWALATTHKQTTLDLAHRPLLGDVEVDVPTAIAALYKRSDPKRLERIAGDQ